MALRNNFPSGKWMHVLIELGRSIKNIDRINTSDVIGMGLLIKMHLKQALWKMSEHLLSWLSRLFYVYLIAHLTNFPGLQRCQVQNTWKAESCVKIKRITVINLWSLKCVQNVWIYADSSYKSWFTNLYYIRCF